MITHKHFSRTVVVLFAPTLLLSFNYLCYKQKNKPETTSSILKPYMVIKHIHYRNTQTKRNCIPHSLYVCVFSLYNKPGRIDPIGQLTRRSFFYFFFFKRATFQLSLGVQITKKKRANLILVSKNFFLINFFIFLFFIFYFFPPFSTFFFLCSLFFLLLLNLYNSKKEIMTVPDDGKTIVAADERTPLMSNTSTIRSHSISSTPRLPRSSSSCINIVGKNNKDSSSSSTKRKLWTAATLAILFFATELIAGYFANSLGKITFFTCFPFSVSV